jgi:hypothetical protein
MASVELEGWDELARQLDRVDDQLTGQVKVEAVQAAGDVVARRAKQLCHRSTQTGTSKGWSDAYFAKRAANKPLAETIAVEVRDYGPRALAVIGPEYPAGAHGHNVENGHEEVLWGQPTGRRVPPHPFMRPAFDETQAEQQAAMQNVVDAKAQELGFK